MIDPGAIAAAKRESCQWCGISASSIEKHVHHIKPRSRGGDDSADNLICLCVNCHKRSHNEVVDGKPPIIANDLRDMLALS